MSDTTILVIEDEEKIARVLELELNYEGYQVEKAHTGYGGLEQYRKQKWDLILLDIMLPEMSGIELLRRIRNDDPITPILLLTAKDSIEDKVTGLDLGANDYITKPFQIEELLARIRAALRQHNHGEQEDQEEWLTFADLKLNIGTREVYRGDKSLELTPREFDLLVYFLNNKRQVLNREQMLDAVWGFDYVGDTNVVDVYVRYLRKKVDADTDRELIHTVRGVGYVLKDAYEVKK
ncbi:response regulator transcription factor [Tenuibacillus multivorans]|uniref:DNA-binding response regulator, OmpR family, contains REC and winged-helix (WHTH) domain n=1 Tax=Tenuibacillus multivorans TaxID=237069 RepID=A0A1G9YGS2_9BACI|nr:response regulator transcription factor [Tenuibacillus multivorans]GEL78540.1 putative transcriptional regulatory protein YkoG [Tenuibacillus multivorans]SDN07711.1 DNA-binding response regulator, OmpR family, contains REC and winged-helix (wHTH) domain [Tenuibacillus multivorans]